MGAMSTKPRLLDLFCKAGGAASGYSRAGFEVVGVDIEPQPHYPFEFHQADALTYPLAGFDAYHASPPCEAYTQFNKGLNQSLHRAKDYPRLIEEIRGKLKSTGQPYVIENVEGAPLLYPIRLCGSSFGLLVQRHRLFESNITLWGLPCSHSWQTKDKPSLHRLQGASRVVGCYGNGRGPGDVKSLWSLAMGITWMTRREMAQAIPPAYTEYVGKQVIKYLLSPSIV